MKLRRAGRRGGVDARVLDRIFSAVSLPFPTLVPHTGRQSVAPQWCFPLLHGELPGRDPSLARLRRWSRPIWRVPDPRAGPSRNLSPPQRSRPSRYRRAKACGRLSRSGILARRRARCGGGRRPSRTGRPTRDPPPHHEDRRPRRRNRGRVALLENQVRACDGPAARARRRAGCVSSQWSSGCQCGEEGVVRRTRKLRAPHG
jgi:hypothetical protein